MIIIELSILAVAGLFLGYVLHLARRKSIGIWIDSYIIHTARRLLIPRQETTHIIFCWVDHFEPMWNDAGLSQQKQRMQTWLNDYPKLADRHRDAAGRPLQHSWFYPGEMFHADQVAQLADLCRAGYGEIEFHHHHHNETSASLRTAFNDAFEKFHKQGVLLLHDNSRAYAFIHGNMGLDNARGDAWCGVNDEITILKETGCYADFSYPVAPCISQSTKVNSIYYVKDDPHQPKSQDTGIDVQVGGTPSGDLMMIQGPLALNWRKRRLGILPTIENAEVQQANPGTPNRVDTWVRQHIHVKGRPERVFVKVSCHGAPEMSHASCLGHQADAMLVHLEQRYNDKKKNVLHYVTAREMYNIIKAAEAGKHGSPSDYLDFAIPQPKYLAATDTRRTTV